MTTPQKVQIRTADLDEIMHAVSRVYCPHEIRFCGSNRGELASFEVIHGGIQPVVSFAYRTAIKVDAGRFPGVLLMQTCIEGGGTITQGDASVLLRRGRTVPMSPGLSTQIYHDGRYAQRSVRLDIERAESLCSRWLNAPLDRPLRFVLRPFSPVLEKAWSQAVATVLAYERMNVTLPTPAVAAFDEFMLSLVLSGHAHNYSDELNAPRKAVAPRIVREARELMRLRGADISVGGVAAQLKVSMRGLEAGFRDALRCTPSQYLRMIRLDAARAQLLSPSNCTTITEVAFNQGFFHQGRFSAYYRQAFGETPSQTLRRSKRALT
jgi:AraC-like DNA-binding protein